MKQALLKNKIFQQVIQHALKNVVCFVFKPKLNTECVTKEGCSYVKKFLSYYGYSEGYSFIIRLPHKNQQITKVGILLSKIINK